MKHEDDDDRYLWDKSGPPDPLVQALERKLAPLAYERPPAAESSRFAHLADCVPTGERKRPTIRWPRTFLIAAAIAAVLVGLFALWESLREREARTSYIVRGLEGVDELRAGDRFDVESEEGALVRIASLGEVRLRPGARGRVEEVHARSHRLFLEEGTLTAKISAAPRVFQVGTPAGMTIDLGCEYDLTVDPDGTAHLSVRTGQVAFETAGRKVIVPRNASCDARKDREPNTPVMNDAAPEFIAAVREIEFADEPRPAALSVVLRESRREDSLSLWHLLDARSAAVREAVYESLARTWPQPAGVTREGILSGDERMRASWREIVQRDWR
jgi:hypothetical protein